MRSVCAALVLLSACGGTSSVVEDDVPPGDAGVDGDPGCTDPATCPADAGTYVSQLTGNDGAAGTKTAPKKTITAAIARAKQLGGNQAVFVAQGTYAEKVTLAEGVDLNGGYECNATSCTWTRDFAAFESTIANQDFEGVLAPPGITPGTLLGGFTIVGKEGAPPVAPGSIGVTIAGSAPTLRGNKIRAAVVTGGGASAADRSIGVAVRGTAGSVAVIENNDIASDQAIGLSAAITLEQINGGMSLAVITNNALRAGAARRSDGIAAFGGGTGTVIADNDILAGNSQGGASNGIETASSVTIQGNRINTDSARIGTCLQATTWCAGIAVFGGSPTITNNVVYGPKAFRATALLLAEVEQPAGTVIVNANYLNAGGAQGQSTATQRSQGSAVVVAIGPCNNCNLKGKIGRIRNNILDGGLNADRFGVREEPAQNKTTTVETLEANDIVFAANINGRVDTLYREVGSFGTPFDIRSIDALNNGDGPVADQNIDDDCELDATWHLGPQSACIDAGVSTEAPIKDFDGESRPAGDGIDIGPDEVP